MKEPVGPDETPETQSETDGGEHTSTSDNIARVAGYLSDIGAMNGKFFSTLDATTGQAMECFLEPSPTIEEDASLSQRIRGGYLGARSRFGKTIQPEPDPDNVSTRFILRLTTESDSRGQHLVPLDSSLRPVSNTTELCEEGVKGLRHIFDTLIDSPRNDEDALDIPASAYPGYLVNSDTRLSDEAEKFLAELQKKALESMQRDLDGNTEDNPSRVVDTTNRLPWQRKSVRYLKESHKSGLRTRELGVTKNEIEKSLTGKSGLKGMLSSTRFEILFKSKPFNLERRYIAGKSDGGEWIITEVDRYNNDNPRGFMSLEDCKSILRLLATHRPHRS